MKLVLLLAIVSFTAQAAAFESFDVETKKVTQNIGCIKPKFNSASPGWGKLYSCIGGKEEAVKFFINKESEITNKVRNVKFLWNDYTKNTGYGIHADATIANAWAASVATMYAPLKVEKVLKVFKSKKNTIIESENYILKYSYSVGPAIDERMFVITKK